jgi:hypothetical protein
MSHSSISALILLSWVVDHHQEFTVLIPLGNELVAGPPLRAKVGTIAARVLIFHP